VVVFVHGGNYVYSTSSPQLFGPHRFMDTQKVVFVSVNYRLLKKDALFLLRAIIFKFYLHSFS
jgi:acetyl esterase/lipase